MLGGSRPVHTERRLVAHDLTSLVLRNEAKLRERRLEVATTKFASHEWATSLLQMMDFTSQMDSLHAFREYGRDRRQDRQFSLF